MNSNVFVGEHVCSTWCSEKHICVYISCFMDGFHVKAESWNDCREKEQLKRFISEMGCVQGFAELQFPWFHVYYLNESWTGISEISCFTLVCICASECLTHVIYVHSWRFYKHNARNIYHPRHQCTHIGVSSPLLWSLWSLDTYTPVWMAAVWLK